ncbi:MAG: glycosyltransferase family 4 protein [Candidatus Schekmanbacteria bacterium]|nr:glycosyltransferase family 4 protein [Candidatus Schekmanbacteria bacterium]
MTQLFVTCDFPPISGGQSRYLYNLWAGIAGSDTIVLAPRTTQDCQEDPFFKGKIVRKWIPLGTSWTARLLRPLVLLIHVLNIAGKESLTVIHCGQVMAAGSVGYIIHFIYGVPYCLYINGADVLEFCHSFPWTRLLQAIFCKADRVFVNSKYTRQLIQNLGVDEKRITLINPAIDLSPFNPPPDTSALAAKWNLQGKRVILTIGRLIERKGQDMVIRSLPAIIERFPQVRYLIAGQGPDCKRLQLLAQELGLSEFVIFAGFVPEAELPVYYNLCEIFIMPSREIRQKGEVEGFGIVYLEANAAAKPVVAGKSGGVTDAVIDEFNGLLVEPQSVKQIESALLQLLSNDTLRQTLGENGKRRVAEKFDRRVQQTVFERAISAA